LWKCGEWRREKKEERKKEELLNTRTMKNKDGTLTFIRHLLVFII
jgi:hypothetical protein